MARILIGWEFGSCRGHGPRLGALARSLHEAGHEPVLALQRLDAVPAEAVPGLQVWQAPVSPRFIVGAAPAPKGPPAGMADLLARAGMDDKAIVVALVRAWQRLLGGVRPDVVIADFAPHLLLAARGRHPTIAFGNGFTLPPSTLPDLPALIETPGVDQQAVLGRVNAALIDAGVGTIAALPQVFAADRSIPATVAELDPYTADRLEIPAIPQSIDFDARSGDGDEIFVYAPERIEANAPLWHALAAAGLPVRAFLPEGDAGLRDALVGQGIPCETEPLTFAEMARRARLLLSGGDHDLVCAGLMAGLPQVICHFDLESLFCGLALARAGLGGHAALGGIKPELFSVSLQQVYNDEGLAARARAAAPGFRTRGQPPAGRTVIEAVESLA